MAEALRAAEQADRQGHEAQAEQHYKEALAQARELADADHRFLTHTLFHFGYFYERRGRYAEAEPLYLELLAVREGLWGREHPDVASSLHYLADLCTYWGKYDQAETYYRWALEVEEKVYGPEHAAVAGTLRTYAAMLRKKHPLKSFLPGSKARQLEARAEAISPRSEERRRKDFATYLAVGFFGFYGLLVGFNGLRMLIRMYASRQWPTTEATIVNSEVVETGGLARYRLEITYRYSVEGFSYVGDTVSFATGNFVWREETARRQVARYVPNTSVPVHYCPRNPKLATLEPGGPIASPALGVLFGTAMLILVFYVFSG
ncbi:MAG: tetratricopeptide repeat protein [Acidobacteria bacterium]|nr:tetratricopeptide repeat protein [Acidobacteriota bacterium]